ncbi:MAG: hypothetical protein IPG17_32790 [Sandaracinaceae bacterium]|nr:hypothetical protein [Sandaracinaceae bacterium]
MRGDHSAPLDLLASRYRGPLALSLILALGAACAAGCGGSRAGTATTTTPVAPANEPRGATGQLLEDAFFSRVPGSDRFDMSAAIDEDGSYGEGDYYDEVAAGSDYDEVATGDDPEAEARRYELTDAQAELAELESALRAEQHPLADAVSELREHLADALAESEESGDTLVLREAVQAILPALLNAAEGMMADATPRPGNATDCSAATIALYAAVFDELVGASAHAHVNLLSYTSEREEWEAAQSEQLEGTTALLQWIESEPALDDLERVRDSASDLGDVLREVDTYLTRGTQQGVDDALGALRDAETEQEMRGGLETLRAAVLATLADVPQPPHGAVIDAFQALPDGLDTIMGHLPTPGPRAALRLYRQHEIARLAELIGYGTEVLGAAVQWAGVACGAPP